MNYGRIVHILGILLQVEGFLMALPLLDADSELEVTGPVESSGYIDMTLDALSLAGCAPRLSGNRYFISGGTRFSMPPAISSVPAASA